MRQLTLFQTQSRQQRAQLRASKQVIRTAWALLEAKPFTQFNEALFSPFTPDQINIIAGIIQYANETQHIDFNKNIFYELIEPNWSHYLHTDLPPDQLITLYGVIDHAVQKEIDDNSNDFQTPLCCLLDKLTERLPTLTLEQQKQTLVNMNHLLAEIHHHQFTLRQAFHTIQSLSLETLNTCVVYLHTCRQGLHSTHGLINSLIMCDSSENLHLLLATLNNLYVIDNNYPLTLLTTLSKNTDAQVQRGLLELFYKLGQMVGVDGTARLILKLRTINLAPLTNDMADDDELFDSYITNLLCIFDFIENCQTTPEEQQALLRDTLIIINTLHATDLAKLKTRCDTIDTWHHFAEGDMSLHGARQLLSGIEPDDLDEAPNAPGIHP